MKKIALFVAMAGFIMTGCVKKDCCFPNVMSVSHEEIDLAGCFDSGTFSLSSPLTWILQNAGDLPDWLEVSDERGNGGPQNITVYGTPNEEEDPFREFILTFMAANGDKVKVVVRQTNEYRNFMANEAPRWEEGAVGAGATVELNAVSPNTFVTDKIGKILDTGKYTVGREESRKGTWFDYLEFEDPDTGIQSGWISTAADDSKPLFRFQILKKGVGVSPAAPDELMLWILFKETANTPERRVVQ